MFYCHLIDIVIDFKFFSDTAPVNHTVGEIGREIGFLKRTVLDLQVVDLLAHLQIAIDVQALHQCLCRCGRTWNVDDDIAVDIGVWTIATHISKGPQSEAVILAGTEIDGVTF